MTIRRNYYVVVKLVNLFIMYIYLAFKKLKVLDMWIPMDSFCVSHMIIHISLTHIHS